LRLYGWRIAVAVLLLFLIVKFAYTLFSILLGIAFICLLVGLFNPESFRPLFGEKTSKATAGWTFGAVVCFCALGASITEPKRETVAPTPTTVAVAPPPVPASPSVEGQGNNTATKPQVVAATKPKATVKPVRKPVAKLSAQETIQGLMERQFGKRLRDVQVTALGRGRYSVKVEFDNSLRLIMETTKDYMEDDMQDAYKAIFTSGLNISEAEVEAFGEGTDKFGKRFRSPAYHTALDGEVAEQIDWSNYRAAKWDELWRVVFLHPNYEKKSSSLFDTVELKAKAGWNELGIQLLNDNAFDWDEVKVYVNPTFGLGGGYSASIGTLRVGEQRFIPYGDLATVRGKRFDPLTTKVLRIKVACQTPEGAAMTEFKVD